MAQLAAVPASTQQREQARSAVGRIASFAAAARPHSLTSEIRQLYKRNILDSLGSGVAALPGAPFTALRELFEEYRAPGRCTLIFTDRFPQHLAARITVRTNDGRTLEKERLGY